MSRLLKLVQVMADEAEGHKPMSIPDHDCPARIAWTVEAIRSTLFGRWCRECERMIDGPYIGRKILPAQFATPLEVE